MRDMQEKIYQAFNLDASRYEPLLTRADARARELAALQPLSDDEKLAMASYNESFLVRFTYNSAAIEGSTLTLADTALVLEGEFMPSDSADKRLSDVFAARGISDGVAFAQRAAEQGNSLSESLIKDIHERTALDCQPRTRGSYRMGAVYIVGSKTVPVAAAQVRELMADLVYAEAHSPEPVLVRAAAFHAMFENIHPFSDGNGRTGRIILNMMLETAGYPPIAVKAANRASYLTALEDWQVRDDPEPMIKIVADQVVEEAVARCNGIMQSRDLRLHA